MTRMCEEKLRTNQLERVHGRIPRFKLVLWNVGLVSRHADDEEKHRTNRLARVHDRIPKFKLVLWNFGLVSRHTDDDALEIASAIVGVGGGRCGADMPSIEAC